MKPEITSNITPNLAYMTECFQNGYILTRCFFISFLLLSLYFILLLFANSSSRGGPFLPAGTIVHRFYLGVTGATLLATLTLLAGFPHCFSSGWILWLVLLMLGVYLVFLQRNDLYKYVITAQEVQRVPLVVATLVCLFALLYTLFSIKLQGLVYSAAVVADILQGEGNLPPTTPRSHTPFGLSGERT